MSQVKGGQATFALFEEDTFGQDPASPDGQLLLCTKFGLQRTRGRHTSNTLNASRGKERSIQGNIDVNGGIDMELSAHEIGTVLKHSLGVVATTGSDPYVHTITCGALPTGLTLEKDHGSVISGSGRFEKFNGCKVASLALNLPQEGFPTVGIELVGATSVYASTALDATLTDNGHQSFSAAEMTVLDEGGSAIAYVTDGSVNLSNELDTDGYVLNSSARRAIPEGSAAISGSITALFESMDLLNKARNNTSSSLKATYSRGDGLGSSGNESIEILVQNLDFEEAGLPIEGPAGVKVTLPFHGYKSGSDLGLKITLKNAVATI
jgi:hypothetical protein